MLENFRDRADENGMVRIWDIPSGRYKKVFSADAREMLEAGTGSWDPSEAPDPNREQGMPKRPTSDPRIRSGEDDGGHDEGRYDPDDPREHRRLDDEHRRLTPEEREHRRLTGDDRGREPQRVVGVTNPPDDELDDGTFRDPAARTFDPVSQSQDPIGGLHAMEHPQLIELARSYRVKNPETLGKDVLVDKIARKAGYVPRPL